MAYHAIQRAALSDRLRRFFGLVGTYRGQLDDVVTPVAQLADLQAQPYDTESERWIARLNVQLTGAEPDFMWGIKNTSGTLVVLDELMIHATKLVNFGIGAVPSIVSGVVPALPLSRDLVSRNVGGFETGANLAPRPVQLTPYTSTTAASNRATTTFQIPPVTAGVMVIPLGHVIGADMVAQLRQATAPAANDTIVAYLKGRIFRDPGLSVTP